MQDIGNALENVGLAQEIQKGLAKSLQKAPKFADWKDEIEAKKAALTGMPGWEVFQTRLGRLVIKEWAKNMGYDLSKGRRKVRPSPGEGEGGVQGCGITEGITTARRSRAR